MVKKISLLLTLLVLTTLISLAQCPTGNITIKTQAELNQLFASYPNCHKIQKSITFSNTAGNPLTDFSPMLKIDTILGDLVINVKNTPTMSGLSNIKYIGGDLSFLSTDQLTKIPDFDSLKEVGLNIEIQNNPKLKSISGFNNLKKVGTVSISENETVDTINAFNEVDSLEYTFSVSFMKKLEVVKACEKLKYCGSNISFNFLFSPNIKTIPPFDELRIVKSDFTITGANTLSYQGLQSLDSLGRNLILAFPLATHFQLAPNARYIANLSLNNCPNLQTLEGFDHLISVQNISLSLPALTQLCPFDQLQTASGSLFASLTQIKSFYAFPNLSTTGSLYLHCHQATAIEAAPLLTSVNGSLTLIGSNVTTCNDFNFLEHIKGELIVQLYNLLQLPGFDNLQTAGLIQIDGSQNLRTINGFNKLVSVKQNLVINGHRMLDSLLGFQQLRYCGGIMKISFNTTLTYLTDFPALDTLGALHLSELSKLPTINGFHNLRYLYNNQLNSLYLYQCFALSSLNGFEKLDYCGEINIVNSAALKKITGFNLLREINGDVTLDSRIDELPDFNNLEKISGKLFISSPTLTKMPNFQKLHSILGDLRIWGCLKIPSLGFWPSLRIIKGSITITNTPLISNLSEISKVDPTMVTQLELNNNKLLSTCNNRFVCGYLALGKPFVISNNAIGCNNSSEIICTGGLIRAETFYDRNTNGIRDAGEPGIANIKVDVNLGDPQLISNDNGEMVMYCEVGGSYDFSAVDNPRFMATTPTSLNYNYSPSDKNKLIFSLGLIHAQNSHAGSVYFTTDALRCNDTINVHIKARNEGSYDENGSITLHFNEVNRFIEFTPAPAVVDAANGTCTWNFTNLIPPSNFTVNGRFRVPSEQNVGDTLRFDLTYDIKNADGSLQRLDSTHFEGLVRCAYDPNDLSVSPLDTLRRSDESQIHQLIYTIRFQNLGNDYAEDVNIYDLITTDLDRNSIQYVTSSHPCNILLYGDILQFDFSGIKLPAKSQNDSLSQGFVTFVVNTKSGLPNETVIGNTAEIVFDQNAPIRTNTTRNTIHDKVLSTLSPDLLQVKWFPNPVSDWLCLQIEDKKTDLMVTVYNNLGQKCYQGKGLCHQLGHLSQGSYLARVQVQDKIQSFVFVKP